MFILSLSYIQTRVSVARGGGTLRDEVVNAVFAVMVVVPLAKL